MELHDLAQHGVVSTADARALGLDPAALRRLTRRGELTRLIRGRYAVSLPGSSGPPWLGLERFDAARVRHRLLTIALLQSFEGRVVASHQSAVTLHGGRLWRSDLSTAHLCRNNDQFTRHRPRAVLHPATGVPSVLTRDGLATVPLALAVVQVGLTPRAPGGEPFPLEALVAADGALHDRLITPAELEGAVGRLAHHPGIPAVRLLLAHADGRHESAGETRLGHAMRVLGYAFSPQLQVEAGGRRWRVDFGLDDHPVIVEFDGLAKYSGGLVDPTAAQLREALAAEKWREDRLRERGNQVVRVIWSELDDLAALRGRIDGAIARSRLVRSA